jgi:hypothetical protein
MSPYDAAREFQIALDTLSQFLKTHPKRKLWTDVEAAVYLHLTKELSDAAKDFEA